ncbi:cytochrome c oxidase-assembly factor [Histoplasma capsulatum var. duboisii H88]|uniref:Cytochrome c oxidase assembly protein COX16, mitochondrial n=1 Tax=Ajellomyces capsulatus (strain H88) TaxID=544711 RepID=F0UI63_AJEC8|nr:cytochrome c oxidase-assembly factor [Histoplasma capsulatum var. duboisii H88]QSS56177.1 cytochrome c oxidase-assembly factor COX16 [Histoplasma capsulatum var. duboisii H88]
MPVFQAKRFRPSTSSGSTLGERLGAKYRANLSKHPFLLFGLPFIGIMVAGSFVLTPATALRYERHDRKVQQLSQEEAMGLGLKGPDGDDAQVKRNPRRRVLGSEKEEYYKLMAKDLDNWEQKRVRRFKGEPDGRL